MDGGMSSSGGAALGGAGALLLALLLAAGAAVWMLRPRIVGWGATAAEQHLALPGDEHLAQQHDTRAIDIDAPPESVWPWIVQMGQDRAGFYSHTWLENLFLAGMRNADRIHPEWQRLEVGDRVRLASARVYGERALLRVLAIEPGSHLVLSSWGSFVLRPRTGARTRLYVRSNRWTGGPLTSLVVRLVFEPAHFVMERAMMEGIRRRAEAAVPSRPGGSRAP